MIRFLFYGQSGESSAFLRSYSNPENAIRINAEKADAERILQALQTIDLWKQSRHVVCLFSYEMGCILQGVPFPGKPPGDYPVLSAYCFESPNFSEGRMPQQPSGHQESSLFGKANERPSFLSPAITATVAASVAAFDLGPSSMGISQKDYLERILQIQEEIRSGRSYQVNFTAPLHFPFSGNAEALFHSLRKRYPAPYCVFGDLGDRQIVSISPELFFECTFEEPVPPEQQMSGQQGNLSRVAGDATTEQGDKLSGGAGEKMPLSYRLQVRPMKGTVRTGKTEEEDLALKQKLLESDKDRAELAMITDLLRNDLGRICPPGRVKLLKAIQPQSFVYVHQLTSHIEGQRSNDSLYEIIPSLFPSGSITGAPRKETMKIIHECEKDYRGIYTGSIGFCEPGYSRFNVAIRTADISGGVLRYGAGGGITLLSRPQEEWQELHWKARPLKAGRPGLIETMRISGGRIRNRILHEKRLLRSARFLRIPLDSKELMETLNRIESATQKGRYRLRLHLSQQELSYTLSELNGPGVHSSPNSENSASNTGNTANTGSPDHPKEPGAKTDGLADVNRRPGSTPAHGPRDRTQESVRKRKKWKLAIAPFGVSSADRLLLHKVDRRACYDRVLDSVRQQGYDEALFYNEMNEITEGAITNVFYRIHGCWYTPPIRCGLLPGVGRKRLLQRFPHRIGFRRLRMEELGKVERIIMVNSMRGLIEAEL